MAPQQTIREGGTPMLRFQLPARPQAPSWSWLGMLSGNSIQLTPHWLLQFFVFTKKPSPKNGEGY